jgi:hypothetical protein
MTVSFFTGIVKQQPGGGAVDQLLFQNEHSERCLLFREIAQSSMYITARLPSRSS